MVRTQSKCECGRVKSKYLCFCKKCLEETHTANILEAQEIVEKGICPRCGSGLKRNSSLAGWWQCEQFGGEGFRKDSSKPACSFQTFTV